MNRLRAAFLALLMVIIAAPAHAGSLNSGPRGLMLKGFDPVAYFEQGTPMRGDRAITMRHAGGVYRFASTMHRELFRANPSRYIPAYGGYCSYGVSIGQKFDADPTAWSIHEDRLFLQLDAGTRIVWLEDERENVRIADRVWQQFMSFKTSGH